MSHPNVARLKAALDAFAWGDLATRRRSFAPHFVWHVSSPRRFAGDRRGWPEFLGYLGLLADMSNLAANIVRFEDGLIAEAWFLDENQIELDSFYR